MRGSKYFFIAGLVLSIIAAGNSFAAVDVILKTDAAADVSDTFDVEVSLSGQDTVLAFTLYVNFDNSKVQITGVTAHINGIISADSDMLGRVNKDGELIIVYLDMSLTGIVPGTEKAMATVTCKAIAGGTAFFEVGQDTNISNDADITEDVTGNFTNTSIIIREGTVPDKTYHSADFRPADFIIGLSELLRVVQFYNVGDYHCDAAGEDGYAAGSGDKSCSPHSADYNPQDWNISLRELLRVVQFYNSSGYHADPESEDGFAPEN